MTNEKQRGLLAFIDDHRGDRTYADLARASDGAFTGNHISTLFSRGVRSMPEAKMVHGLARALRVPVAAIVAAVLVDLGIEVDQPGQSDLVISGAGELPASSKQALRATAENMLWWQAQVETVGVAGAREGVDKDSAEYLAMSVEERIAAAGVTEQGEVDLAAYAPGGKTVREQQEEAWADSEDQSPEDPDHVA